MHDSIVVGAGPAGLAASWHLARRGIDHLVLERGRVGETWRSQRWDSFALNSPTWASRLPGSDDALGPPDGFVAAGAWVAHLEGLAARHRTPVRPGTEVTGLRREPDGTFAVEVDAGGARDSLRARSVVVAAGAQREERIPALADRLPADVLSIHTAAYRNPAALPPGAVLVVGAAQSGGQVAEDLLDAGRTVHLATSRVTRVRRRLYGRDVFDWLIGAGFFDVPRDQVADPAVLVQPQPIISGVGRHGHTLSLQWLEARGARLLGRLRSIDGGRLTFDDDLGTNIRHADEQSAQATREITTGLREAGLLAELPPLEEDAADAPHPDPDGVRAPTTLDLVDAGISTVIWATGFRPALPWLPPEVRDEQDGLRHAGGATALPGLVAVGLPWLRTRGSGILYGMDRDAAAVTGLVADHLAS